MKTKALKLMAIMVSALLLMSTTCEKQNDDPDICDGPAQITVSGEINNSFCFGEVANQNLEDEFTISMDSYFGTDDLAMLFVRLGSSNDNIPAKAGTFQCGYEHPAFIQLGFHGTNNEFYNSDGGTITVTKLDQNEFKATFTITASGYYSGNSVNITATINKLSKHNPQ